MTVRLPFCRPCIAVHSITGGSHFRLLGCGRFTERRAFILPAGYVLTPHVLVYWLHTPAITVGYSCSPRVRAGSFTDGIATSPPNVLLIMSASTRSALVSVACKNQPVYWNAPVRS